MYYHVALLCVKKAAALHCGFKAPEFIFPKYPHHLHQKPMLPKTWALFLVPVKVRMRFENREKRKFILSTVEEGGGILPSLKNLCPAQ